MNWLTPVPLPKVYLAARKCPSLASSMFTLHPRLVPTFLVTNAHRTPPPRVAVFLRPFFEVGLCQLERKVQRLHLPSPIYNRRRTNYAAVYGSLISLARKEYCAATWHEAHPWLTLCKSFIIPHNYGFNWWMEELAQIQSVWVANQFKKEKKTQLNCSWMGIRPV